MRILFIWLYFIPSAIVGFFVNSAEKRQRWLDAHVVRSSYMPRSAIDVLMNPPKFIAATKNLTNKTNDSKASYNEISTNSTHCNSSCIESPG